MQLPAVSDLSLPGSRINDGLSICLFQPFTAIIPGRLARMQCSPTESDTLSNNQNSYARLCIGIMIACASAVHVLASPCVGGSILGPNQAAIPVRGETRGTLIMIVPRRCGAMDPHLIRLAARPSVPTSYQK